MCRVRYCATNERHERRPCARRAPVPPQEVNVLKALATGVCALFLCVTSAAAHVASKPTGDPSQRLAGHLQSLQHSRQVVRFFRTHRWLLSDPRFAATARRQLAIHTRTLRTAERRVAGARAALERRRLTRRLAAVRAETPQQAICRVFGPHCRQALEVAHCESRYSTSARNGQYLGLFQMGSSERRLFGHGDDAEEQARAAHRYFVHSGRDWSPWSCKPW